MRDFTYPAIIGAAKVSFRMLGLQFQISGTEYVPRSGGAVLACNHISYVDYIFDGLAAYPSRRLVRFMAKKEVFDNRIAGPLMRSLHHIEVDRGSGEQSAETAAKFARDGEVVGIFPEATISRSFEIKKLRTGAVRIAAAAGVPLIPMVTWGTQLLKTKDHDADLFGRGKTIALHVGEPLAATGADPVAETAQLHAALATLLDKAITQYPISPVGKWWAPSRYGGLAPTPQEADRMDAEEYAARRAARDRST